MKTTEVTLKKYLVPALVLIGFLGCAPDQALRVYHTNLPENHPTIIEHTEELFGQYNDIVVEFQKDQQIIFSKHSSFLPIWKIDGQSYHFPELVERKGDGPEGRPDLISQYSHARVIKKSRDTVVVHWRYFPDLKKINPTDVVEEYFTVNSHKTVIRTSKKGTSKFKDWKGHSGMITQFIELNSNGVKVLKQTENEERVSPTTPQEAIEIAKVKSQQSSIDFSFDHQNRDAILNLANGRFYQIEGNETTLRKGISGKALELDGYRSGIVERDLLKDDNLDEFTIQSWIALSAYPFEWAPIIQQADWEDAGFYLGINKDGQAGIHVRVDNEWKSVVHNQPLDLRKWYFLAATFSITNQSLSLFVNGELVGAKTLEARKLIRHNSDVTIGLNRQKMPDIKGRMGRGKYPSLIGLEGLLDELSVIETALSKSEIKNNFESLSQKSARFPESVLSQRYLPKLPRKKGFKATYDRLSLYPTWDKLWRVGDYPDIIVHFENNPSKLVFWRGTSYGPFYVTENNKWIGDQSNEDYLEDWGIGEAEGCLEHMSDKQNRHSFVRIIHQSDARIIIHWRYASVDSRYLFSAKNDGWGTWTDEYWIIYPDGIAIRHLPHSICFGDGWIENMFLNGPGEKPSDNIELEAFSVVGPDEKRVDYSWADMPAKGSMDAMISMVNTKSKNRMFCIYNEDSGIEIFSGKNPRYKFHSWNHWPVSQLETDGRSARAEDRITHSSLMHGATDANYLMYGITEKSIEDLIPLAKFWRGPPPLQSTMGITKATYRPEQRAYIIEGSTNQIEFTMVFQEGISIVSPVFVVKNWNADLPKIWINNTLSTSEDITLGLEETETGTDLIIFMKKQKATQSIKVKISN
ncbi:MAG: LamG domain-containing protein [Bacteroidota bacterium]